MGFLGRRMRKLKASSQIDHIQDLFAGQIYLVCMKILCHFWLMSMCVCIIRSLHLSSFSACRWKVGCLDKFFFILRPLPAGRQNVVLTGASTWEANEDVQSAQKAVAQIERDDIEHPVTLSNLDAILHRTSAWQKTLKSSRRPASSYLRLVKLQVRLDRTVVEIQLQSQENFLETMFDGTDEGVISEHEKIKWKRCLRPKSWSPLTFFFW